MEVDFCKRIFALRKQGILLGSPSNHPFIPPFPPTSESFLLVLPVGCLGFNMKP